MTKYSCSLVLILILSACQNLPRQERTEFTNRAQSAAERTLPEMALKDWNRPQPLDLNRPARIVLQVDGGAIMGAGPAVLLRELEARIRQRRDCSDKRLKDVVSVCSGTSTGAIITGMVAAGVPAEAIADYYANDGRELFNRTGRNRFPIFPFVRPQFKRHVFQDALLRVLAKNLGEDSEHITLNDLYDGPLLIIPAFDLCSNRTHFFRTRDWDGTRLDYNGDVQLVDAISASALSAAVFFGKLPAPTVVWDHVSAEGTRSIHRGAVYHDGGQGTQNNTLALALAATLAEEWANPLGANEQVVVISLGCGNSYPVQEYDSRRRLSGTGQLLGFLKNQARPESPILQWRVAMALAARNPNIKVFRFDWEFESGSSPFSAKYLDRYVQAGERMIQRSDFQRLVSDLCRVSTIRSLGRQPLAPIRRLPLAPKSLIQAL